jgi:hypothetical protein
VSTALAVDDIQYNLAQARVGALVGGVAGQRAELPYGIRCCVIVSP